MYDHQKVNRQILAPTAIDTAANPIAGSRHYNGTMPLRMRAIWATVTVAVTTTATVLTFKARPTPGSATGEITIGTLTIPTSAAVGRTVYKKGLDVMVPAGHEISIQTDGAGDAGTVAAGFEADPSWEAPVNNSLMLASA